MAILGYAQLQNDGLLSNWDKDEMNKVKLADGRGFTDVLEEADSAVQEASQAFVDDPRFAGLLAVQDMPEVEYSVGNTGGVKELTDQGVPDPRKGQTAGHQVNLKDWGDALGWTLFGLRDRRTTQIEADIMTAVGSVQAHLQYLTLQSFFRMEAVTIGSSGKMVPFADGGTADSTYIPPTSPEGTSFANTHDHFLRHAAINDANVNAVIDHLWEHGHRGPFNIVASALDVSSFTGLTGYRKPQWNDLNYQQSAEIRATVVDNDLFIGYFEGDKGIARIWINGRIPTAYWGAYKDYGALDPRNPLRARIAPVDGFGFKMVPGNWVNTPSQLAVYHARHGIGVGQDRTNGVCVYVAGSGDYVTPTITSS
jgi:hypothetical protein